MQSAADDFDPSENATAKLMQHITEKGFQAGSVLGVALRLPLLAYRRRSTGVTAQTALGVLSRTALVTTVCTGALGLAKIYAEPLTADGIEDRVYRLHYNQGQNRTDAFSRTGALVGAAAAAARFGLQGNILIGGAAFGTGLAIAAHVVTSREEAEKGLQTGPANLLPDANSEKE